MADECFVRDGRAAVVLFALDVDEAARVVARDVAADVDVGASFARSDCDGGTEPLGTMPAFVGITRAPR